MLLANSCHQYTSVCSICSCRQFTFSGQWDYCLWNACHYICFI